MYEILYEDDNWVIDKSGSSIRISYFEDNHFKDDLELSKEIFQDEDCLDRIKELISDFNY